MPRPAIVARIPDLSLAFQAQFSAPARPCHVRVGAANASERPWAFAKINGAATVRERAVPLKSPVPPPREKSGIAPPLQLRRRTPLGCGASMGDDISQDPYRLGPEDIQDPPRKFTAIFRRIGPGLILAGSVVEPRARRLPPATLLRKTRRPSSIRPEPDELPPGTRESTEALHVAPAPQPHDQTPLSSPVGGTVRSQVCCALTRRAAQRDSICSTAEGFVLKAQ